MTWLCRSDGMNHSQSQSQRQQQKLLPCVKGPSLHERSPLLNARTACARHWNARCVPRKILSAYSAQVRFRVRPRNFGRLADDMELCCELGCGDTQIKCADHKTYRAKCNENDDAIARCAFRSSSPRVCVLGGFVFGEV